MTDTVWIVRSGDRVEAVFPGSWPSVAVVTALENGDKWVAPREGVVVLERWAIDESNILATATFQWEGRPRLVHQEGS